MSQEALWSQIYREPGRMKVNVNSGTTRARAICSPPWTELKDKEIKS